MPVFLDRVLYLLPFFNFLFVFIIKCFLIGIIMKRFKKYPIMLYFLKTRLHLLWYNFLKLFILT